MDLLQKQRESVANHIRLENEHLWAEVNTTLVQDERAFFDFVSVGQFKGAEGVRQLYHVVSTAFPDLPRTRIGGQILMKRDRFNYASPRRVVLRSSALLVL